MKLYKKLCLLAPIFSLAGCGNLANFYDDMVNPNFIEVAGIRFNYSGLTDNSQEAKSAALSYYGSYCVFGDDYTFTFYSGTMNAGGTYRQQRRKVFLTVLYSNGQLLPEEERVEKTLYVYDYDLHLPLEINNLSFSVIYTAEIL